MLLKNLSPRLISINVNTNIEDTINLMPAGEAVDVPDAACNTRYVRALIQSKSVEKVGESPVKSDDPLKDMTLSDLKTYADSQEIDYDGKIKKADLKALIESQE